VIFSDGNFIAIEDLVVEDLNPKYRKELEDLNLLSTLSLRKRLHEHGNSLQRIENMLLKLDEKLDSFEDFKDAQVANCPVNSKAIEQIVEEQFKTSKEIRIHFSIFWWEEFKKKIINAKSLVAAILFLAGILVALVLIVGKIKL